MLIRNVNPSDNSTLYVDGLSDRSVMYSNILDDIEINKIKRFDCAIDHVQGEIIITIKSIRIPFFIMILT